jgi:hypothetical protein
MSVDTIFDDQGQAVSWMKDGVIFNADGSPAAFIEHKCVFSGETGDYLGLFDHNLFHDRLGCIVAFTQQAKRSFYLPRPHAGQTPPVLHPRPLPARACHAAAPFNLAKPLRDHSTLNWEQYLKGCEAQWPWETRH